MIMVYNSAFCDSLSIIGSCPAGTYTNYDTDACIPCALGTYSEQDSQTACINCPAGKTTMSTGSDDQSLCVDASK